jgi:hypothetical protein
MSSLDVVMKYMEIFYSGHKLERLHEVLADDLEFSGPFFTCNSSKKYVDSLISDPPIECNYHLLNTFEQDNCINLIYMFYRGTIVITMSQLFKVHDNRINHITLIFDTRPFYNDENTG